MDEHEEVELSIADKLDLLKGMAALLKMKTGVLPETIGRYSDGNKIVSTIKAPDLKEPFKYETAISHPNYNDGNIIPVEAFVTREEAEAGHEKWVKLMMDDKLPAVVQDKSKSYFAEVLRKVDGLNYERGDDGNS
jgi:hypothetical protein